MKVYQVYILFFILSVSLIAMALFQSGKINNWKQQTLKVKVIQKVCKKKYLRKRKIVIYPKSLVKAQKEIDKILLTAPIDFSVNSMSLESNNTKEEALNHSKVTLNKILTILNNLEEDAILSISTHTDVTGSKEHNLKLSQERANMLKKYFRDKCSLPLIVAIGYGEEIPLPKESKGSNRRVELELKRIQ